MRPRLIVLLVVALMLGVTFDADGATKKREELQVFTREAFVEPGYTVVVGLARHDRGLAVRWRFKWGRSKAPYEHITEAPEDYVLNGNGPVEFEEVLEPLRPDTTYHYRAIAWTARGKGVGQDKTFHTPPSRP